MQGQISLGQDNYMTFTREQFMKGTPNIVLKEKCVTLPAKNNYIAIQTLIVVLTLMYWGEDNIFSQDVESCPP